MTWSARLTVTDVDHYPDADDGGLIEIIAAGRSDEKVTIDGREYPGVVANTEGELLDIEVTFTLRGFSTKVEKGDVLYASGSFHGGPRVDRISA